MNIEALFTWCYLYEMKAVVVLCAVVLGASGRLDIIGPLMGVIGDLSGVEMCSAGEKCAYDPNPCDRRGPTCNRFVKLSENDNWLEFELKTTGTDKMVGVGFGAQEAGKGEVVVVCRVEHPPGLSPCYFGCLHPDGNASLGLTTRTYALVSGDSAYFRLLLPSLPEPELVSRQLGDRCLGVRFHFNGANLHFASVAEQEFLEEPVAGDGLPPPAYEGSGGVTGGGTGGGAAPEPRVVTVVQREPYPVPQKPNSAAPLHLTLPIPLLFSLFLI